MAVAWALLLKVAVAQQAEAGLWLGLQLTALAGETRDRQQPEDQEHQVDGDAGGHVVGALLPAAQAHKWYGAQQWSMIILLLLLVTGLLSVVILPPMEFFRGLLFALVGIR
jgi:hypothetical protein